MNQDLSGPHLDLYLNNVLFWGTLIYIYIYKVDISVCLSVCFFIPIITEEPFDLFASILIGELGITPGMF